MTNFVRTTLALAPYEQTYDEADLIIRIETTQVVSKNAGQ